MDKSIITEDSLMNNKRKMNFTFSTNIILESRYLLLQPLQLKDIDNLLNIATGDPDLLQFSPKQVYSKDLLSEYIHTAIELRKIQARYSFSIFSKINNCYVGSTAFLNVSNADDRLEIGATWIGKAFQGTGLNRGCKNLLLQYAFDSLNANRVEFKTDERNMQSRKAIEKIGGKFEGILREHMLMSDGFRRNTFCYSILQSEWNQLRNPVNE